MGIMMIKFIKKHWVDITQSIAIFVSLLMSSGLYIEYYNYKLSSQAYEESLTPHWGHGIDYLDNGKGIKSITFYSKNESITLQNFEVYFPSEIKNVGQQKSYSDTWICNNLPKVIKTAYSKHFKANTQIEFHYHTECLPVIVKFNYVQFGRLKTQAVAYNINFSIYRNNKIRIRSLTQLRTLSIPSNLYSNYLDELNCLTCFETLDCINSEVDLLDDIVVSDRFKIIEQFISLGSATTKITVIENDKKQMLIVPTIAVNKNKYEEYIALEDSMATLEDIDPNIIFAMSDLAFGHKRICPNMNYECIIKNEWHLKEVRNSFLTAHYAIKYELVKFQRLKELESKYY